MLEKDVKVNMRRTRTGKEWECLVFSITNNKMLKTEKELYNPKLN